MGGGGGRGLSGPEAGGGVEAKEGGLAPGSWPSRPPMGEGAGLGQGPAPGLGPAGHGAGSYSPRCLPVSFSFLSESRPGPPLSSQCPHPKWHRTQKPCLGLGLKPYLLLGYPCPPAPGASPPAQGKGPHPNICPLLPRRSGQENLSTSGRGARREAGGAVPQLQPLAEAVEKEAAQCE